MVLPTDNLGLPFLILFQPSTTDLSSVSEGESPPAAIALGRWENKLIRRLSLGSMDMAFVYDAFEVDRLFVYAESQ